MTKEKKFINDPKCIAKESLKGYLSAAAKFLHQGSSEHVIVANDLPGGKVGVLIGGGIAAEPLFMGYVGKNMADCAVIGNINAAPAPDLILAGTKAINQGKGVIYVYNNYPGDILCFDMAAEFAEEEGIEIRTICNHDDVGSASVECKNERRGIAGAILLIKVVGGAASLFETLDEVCAVSERARDNIATLIVTASAGSFLENGEKMFSLGEREIEIGVGFHGEPGLGRQSIMPANDIVDIVLDKLLADLECKSGDELAILVNSMGATSITELFIINNRVYEILTEKEIQIYNTDIGFYYNSQNMLGFSISIMKLDDELKKCIDVPVNSFSYKK